MADAVTLSEVGAEPWGRELRRTRWAHRTPTFQGISFRFGVRCTDARLGRYVESVLSPLRSPVPAAHWYSVVTTRAGRVDLFFENNLLAQAADPVSAVAWLCWDVNRAVVDASSKHLLFHAGGVQARDGGVLLPGGAGAGKTTLVAALVRAGLGYLSDEIVALTTSGATLLPYPKSLTVKAGSFAALRNLEPTKSSELSSLVREADVGGTNGPLEAREWHVTPSDIRPGAVGKACGARVVISPRYVRDTTTTTLSPLDPNEAFLVLATNTVNLHEHGALGVRVLAELVESCDCHELVMSDLDDACRLVLAVLEERPQ